MSSNIKILNITRVMASKGDRELSIEPSIQQQRASYQTDGTNEPEPKMSAEDKGTLTTRPEALLEPVDDLWYALLQMTGDNPNRAGFEQILNKLVKAVCDHFQLELILPGESDDFTPELHEAIATACGPEGKVVQVKRLGFRYQDGRLRPAEVVVGNGEVSVSIKGTKGATMPPCLSDGRAVDWQWCLCTWDRIGRPVVHAGPNDNIFDLSLFLYPEKVSPKRLEAIVNWLEEHSGEKMPDYKR